MGVEPTYSSSAGIVYHDPIVRNNFVQWLKSRNYSPYYVRDILSYLDHYVITIKQPLDIVALFSRVQKGKNNLIKGIRLLFNFYEILGSKKDYLDRLRKALPKTQTGIDLKIPNENEVLSSIGKSALMPIQYDALYNLLLDSGLRLTEATYVINTFTNAEPLNGFFRCGVALFRGCKQSYYAHFSECTFNLIKQVKEKLGDQIASTFFDKKNVVNPKYLRKYVFDKMIELEIPESVADFIEGRVPRRVGAKHYMALARQAGNFYPKYLNHVSVLRHKLDLERTLELR